MEKETPSPCGKIEYQLKDKNKETYDIIFTLGDDNIEVEILEKESFATNIFKSQISLSDFQEKNKFFLMLETISEVFEFFLEHDLKSMSSIIVENNIATLSVKLPEITKKKRNEDLEIVIEGSQIKENELVKKLCDKSKEINHLRKKISFLMKAQGINDEDLERLENIYESIKDSTVIEDGGDLFIVEKGIKRKSDNKKIKEMKLIFRASVDGDSSSTFHSKCNGKGNTVTFVRSTTNRRFGGFAEQAWNSNGSYFNDAKAFIFSLDESQVYYRNGNGNDLYGSSSYGPTFGEGHDLYIANGCFNNTNSSNSQKSYNWHGDIYVLEGKQNFKVKDYEVYEIKIE